MGFFTDFDHHAVSRDLDVASWDSYPLGFLEQFWFPAADKQRYARQGGPDIAAFHHDLYRGCAKGRWWVMEQQPGPVNWASHNPAPLPGMVRLWTLEAMAHGAELVSYFRWRQAPFAQEQMHAGLLRPDRVDDVGAHEARAAAADIAEIGEVGPPPKSVALLFSYDAQWLVETQPQGRDFRHLELAFDMYAALRRLGLDIDIVPPDAPLDGYDMVVVPCLPVVDDAVLTALSAVKGPLLLGPRTGSKTVNCSIRDGLPPGQLMPLKVTRVESLRAGVEHRGDDFVIRRWIETVESDLTPEVTTTDGRGVVYASTNRRYLAAWPDAELLDRLFRRMAGEAGLTIEALGADLRMRRAGGLRFAFNYGPEAVELPDSVPDLTIGSRTLSPAGVAIWQE